MNDTEQRLREQEVRPLLARVRAIEPLTNGCRLDFGDGGGPDDTHTASLIRQLGEFVARERACCPFVDFDLRVGRDGGKVTLTMHSREQALPVFTQFVAFVREVAKCRARAPRGASR